LRLEFLNAPQAFDTKMMRIHEARDAEDHLNVVARKLRLRDIHFGLDDVLHAEGEIGHRDLFLHAIVDAVNALEMIPGEMQHGLPHRFAGDRSGIDARSPDHFPLLDKRYALACFGYLDSRALARR